MPLAPLDIAGWALAAGALALLGWAPLSDRARHRPRCPKCWYDLRAHDTSEAADPPLPITCPECGTRPHARASSTGADAAGVWPFSPSRS